MTLRPLLDLIRRRAGMTGEYSEAEVRVLLRVTLEVRVKPTKERTPRVDGAGLLRCPFALDVFACAWCGGLRRVLAYVTAPQ